MDLGHSCRVEYLARLSEKARQLLEPRGSAEQPILEWGEFAGGEVINRTAGEIDIAQRVPGPFL